jgi:tRNA(His) 5'-end guanylyltransferase
MKKYESLYSINLMDYLPTLARIDGKAFHTFTRGLSKPFDPGLMAAMQFVTHDLVKETGAKLGYTQSDEISLLFWQDELETQYYLGGKINKLNSILASMTTQFFINRRSFLSETHQIKNVFFDCRTWQVPNKIEAANYFVWRENDAARNSVQMVGQHHFSQKQLHGLSCNEIQDRLMTKKGINWNDLAPSQKRGTFYKKDGMYIINDFFLRKATNKVEVIFEGAEPTYEIGT